MSPTNLYSTTPQQQHHSKSRTKADRRIISLLLLGGALDREQLEGEDENGSAWDGGAGPAIAVSQLAGNVQLPFTTFLHELHGLGPALDDLVGGEGEGRTALVAGIEFGPVNEGAGVVAFARGRDEGRLAGAGRDLLVPGHTGNRGRSDCSAYMRDERDKECEDPSTTQKIRIGDPCPYISPLVSFTTPSSASFLARNATPSGEVPARAVEARRRVERATRRRRRRVIMFAPVRFYWL